MDVDLKYLLPIIFTVLFKWGYLVLHSFCSFSNNMCVFILLMLFVLFCLLFLFKDLLSFSNVIFSWLWQGLSKSTLSSKFSMCKFASRRYQDLPVGYRPVRVDWKDLDKCSVCHMDEVPASLISFTVFLSG